MWPQTQPRFSFLFEWLSAHLWSAWPQRWDHVPIHWQREWRVETPLFYVFLVGRIDFRFSWRKEKKGGNKTYLYILKLLSQNNVFLALSWQGKRSSLKQRHLGTRLIGEAGDGFPFAAQSRDLSNSCIPTSRKKSRILGDSIIQQLREISAPWPCCGSLRLCVRSRPTWEFVCPNAVGGTTCYIRRRHHQFETSLFHIILLSSPKNPKLKAQINHAPKKRTNWKVK